MACLLRVPCFTGNDRGEGCFPVPLSCGQKPHLLRPNIRARRAGLVGVFLHVARVQLEGVRVLLICRVCFRRLLERGAAERAFRVFRDQPFPENCGSHPFPRGQGSLASPIQRGVHELAPGKMRAIVVERRARLGPHAAEVECLGPPVGGIFTQGTVT